MKTFAGVLNLIFFGAVPLVVASIYLADSDRVLNPDEVLLTGAAIVLGAVLVVSGLLGALRLSGARKLKVVPKATFAERLVAVLLGLIVGVGVVSTARVRNVMLVEQSEWQRAVAGDSSQSYARYVQFLNETRPTKATGAMRLVRLNDTAWLFDMFSASNTHAIEATMAIDDTSYREAVKAGSSAALRAYLAKYNPGRHVGEASEALDDASWREAEKVGTAAALRAYRQEFARGRHEDEAKAALQGLYQAAEAKYDALVSERKGDPAAAAGIKALLAGLREEDVDTDKVAVSFLAAAGVANEAVEKASKSKTPVVPVAPAFSATAGEARARGVFEALDGGLQAVTGDLFRLELRPAEESRGELRILVHHLVRATGEMHQPADQAALPAAQRRSYAGIDVVFTASVQVPGNTPTGNNTNGALRFSQTVKPAPGTYEAMADAAFSEWRKGLLKAYALGE